MHLCRSGPISSEGTAKEQAAGIVDLSEQLLLWARTLRLLDAILRRGQTRTYDHGARYLRKLDSLAASVFDWCGIAPHATYKDSIRRQHARKSSFWSRYHE